MPRVWDGYRALHGAQRVQVLFNEPKYWASIHLASGVRLPLPYARAGGRMKKPSTSLIVSLFLGVCLVLLLGIRSTSTAQLEKRRHQMEIDYINAQTRLITELAI